MGEGHRHATQAEGLARVGGLLELATKLRGNVFVSAMGYSLSNLHGTWRLHTRPGRPTWKWAPYLKAVLMQFWAGPTSDDPAERQALYEKYGRGPGASIRWVREKSSQMQGMHDTPPPGDDAPGEGAVEGAHPVPGCSGGGAQPGPPRLHQRARLRAHRGHLHPDGHPGWIAKHEQSLEEFSMGTKRAVDAADSASG